MTRRFKVFLCFLLVFTYTSCSVFYSFAYESSSIVQPYTHVAELPSSGSTYSGSVRWSYAIDNIDIQDAILNLIHNSGRYDYLGSDSGGGKFIFSVRYVDNFKAWYSRNGSSKDLETTAIFNTDKVMGDFTYFNQKHDSSFGVGLFSFVNQSGVLQFDNAFTIIRASGMSYRWVIVQFKMHYSIYLPYEDYQFYDIIIPKMNTIVNQVNKLTSIQNDISTISQNLIFTRNFVSNGFRDTIALQQSILDAIKKIQPSDSQGVVDAINKLNNDVTGKIDNSTTKLTDKIGDSTTKLTDKIGDAMQQESDFRNDDITAADGFEATGQKFVTDMQSTVKTKWAILFYPFEYSKQIIDVITNGTQSTYYKSYYNYVVGYHYDELTGGLLPILDFQQPRLNERAGGTVITFPAFTLPVLDLKIWDSFSFDLSTIKQQFPAVFNMMYLVAGIIETDLFVKFMRSKFDEVFGGDE